MLTVFNFCIHKYLIQTRGTAKTAISTVKTLFHLKILHVCSTVFNTIQNKYTDCSNIKKMKKIQHTCKEFFTKMYFTWRIKSTQAENNHTSMISSLRLKGTVSPACRSLRERPVCWPVSPPGAGHPWSICIWKFGLRWKCRSSRLFHLLFPPHSVEKNTENNQYLLFLNNNIMPVLSCFSRRKTKARHEGTFNV